MKLSEFIKSSPYSWLSFFAPLLFLLVAEATLRLLASVQKEFDGIEQVIVAMPVLLVVELVIVLAGVCGLVFLIAAIKNNESNIITLVMTSCLIIGMAVFGINHGFHRHIDKILNSNNEKIVIDWEYSSTSGAHNQDQK